MQLSTRRRRILRAFFEAMRPRGSALDAEIDTDALVATFEDFFRFVEPTVQRGFPLMLEALEYGTFLLAGRSRPFSRLSPREQEAYLRDWQESPLSLRRDMYKAMQALFSLVYYSRPSVGRAFGYEHQAFAEAVRRLRFERFGPEIQAREARIQRGPAEPLGAPRQPQPNGAPVNSEQGAGAEPAREEPR